MLSRGASRSRFTSSPSGKSGKQSINSLKSFKSIRSGRSALSRASKGRQSVESVLDSFRLNRRNSTLLEDEIEDAIDPNAVEIQIWQQVLLVCLLFEVYIIPFIFTFHAHPKEALPPEYFVIFFCEFMFLFDFYVQSHTGYYEDGNVIRDKRKTRRRFFRSKGFLLDLIAAIPLSVVTVPASMSRITLEVHKLTRCWRLGKYVSNLDDFYARHFVKLKLLKVMVTTMFVSHFVACVRFWFGYDKSHTNHWLPEAPETETEASVRSEYLRSLFWSFGVLSGLFEGELPHTIAEFVFTIIVALCGFSLFTSLYATFFMVSKCESGQTEALEARINQLKHLLCFHRVPDNLQQQAIEYLKRYYTDDESSDREATKLLCPSIVKDIQVELLKDTVAQIPLFSGCSDQFLTALTGLLEMFSVPAQFTLCQAGDFGDAMYIVRSGVLNVMISGVKIREMRKGVCFGELSVFSSSPRTATVISATYAVLYKLSRFHSERVLEGYPRCAAIIANHVGDLFHNAKQKSFVMTSSNASTDSSDNQQQQASSSSRSSRNSIIITQGAALIRKSITNSTAWPGKKPNQVFPSHEEAISEAISPRDDVGGDGGGSVESPRALPLKTTTEQTLNYYSQQSKSQQDALHCWWQPWRALLLKTCIDANSRMRMWWILALMLNLIYNWLIVPLQLAFPMMKRVIPAIAVLDTLADVVLLVDMYLSFNLSFTLDSEKITDTVRSAARYFRQGFLFDLVCALPYLVLIPSMGGYGIPRLPRLLRIFRLGGHLGEIDHHMRLSSKQRLLLFGLLLIMLYHIIACMHFATTYVEGFSESEDAWIPSQDIFLRQINKTHFQGLNETIYSVSSTEFQVIAKMQYFRSLYYATNVLAALGKTIEPASDVQFSIAIVFMLSGFMITAIVVDNVQKRFTASAFEQKEFFATRSRIQLFLLRQNASLAIHHRVNSFLNFWWSSHRGAMIGELLADLPPTIRQNILRSICNPVLQTLALVAGVRTVLDKLEDVMVENVKFVLYGQGEIVYRQGDYATGVFFLLEGQVCVITEGNSPRGVSLGGFFGTASLLQSESSEGYGEHVSATSSCILLFMASEHLKAMEAIFPQLPIELLALEKRLLGNKLAKTDVGGGANSRRQTSSASQSSSSSQQRGIARWLGTTAFDPDSVYVLAWESCLFMVMTVQWITVLFQICFRMVKSTHGVADAVTFSLEFWFFLDVYIRSRLGFYEYGNKVMDLKQIRRSYFRSTTFALDLLALMPLYTINWCRSPMQRVDTVNINKLLRLFKVPRQFSALENRFLKLTMELRLLRLLYYTFMLTHIFGCVWFDFASNASRLGLSGQHESQEEGEQENEAHTFGMYKWLPSETLFHSSLTTQYTGSLFWAFGLMSASNTGELPKTTPQCIFSVVTMTAGFFLFAYVIGNFTDIIELSDAENRAFNAKMSSVRHLLAHFKLPPSLEDRLKTFFFFKRFHSITQEHLLESCLPPSLLTDIRLVHLKPMIAKVAFLSGMEGSVTRMLVSQFSQSVVLRGQYVCRYGEEGSDMYFVFTGMLDVLMPIDLLPDDDGDEDSGGQGNEFAHTPLIKAGRNGSTRLQTLKKINEISAGSYFGENGLFTKSLRNAHVRAQTSCILYNLSRESLELVFERYPAWKQKVIRIANLQNEQQRLNRLSQEEQLRHTTDEDGSAMLSKIDVLNQRAEKMEEELQLVRIKRTDSIKRIVVKPSSSLVLRVWDKHLRHQLPELVRQLRAGARTQSQLHLFWLGFMTSCTVYIAVVVPYRISLDPLERDTPLANLTKGVEIFCELLFIVDIWFSMRVQQCWDSMELYEQAPSVTYKKERMLWDVVAALPVYHVVLEFSDIPWLRLLHCFKVVNITSYLSELNRRSVDYELNRFRGVWLIYMLCIYWIACAYLAIAIYDGHGDEWDAWLPSKEVEITDPANPSAHRLVLRFFRGVFYAITAFVKKGHTFTPDTATHYVFSIICSFIGLLVMSFMIGEIASLFISYIGVEVDFRRNHIAVELYLARLNVSSALKGRAHAFMFSLWSSHSGVNYEAIFAEISPPIRTACALHIAQQPLEWFMCTVFRPLSWDGSNELEAITSSIAQELRFEEYPRDEYVVTEGSISKAMYFVIKGHLCLQSKTHTALLLPVGLHAGDFFGERGLLGCAVSTFSVRSIRACDLLSLSSESLLRVINTHAVSRLALLVAQQAYRKIKAEVTVSCSSSAMEEHWGNALVSVLQQFRERVRVEPKRSSVGLISQQQGANGSVVDEDASEFQSRVKSMATTLETPTECNKAFHGILQIIAPNDPLDWNASFGHNARLAAAPTDSERRASFTQASLEVKAQLTAASAAATAALSDESSGVPDEDLTPTDGRPESPSPPAVCVTEANATAEALPGGERANQAALVVSANEDVVVSALMKVGATPVDGGDRNAGPSIELIPTALGTKISEDEDTNESDDVDDTEAVTDESHNENESGKQGDDQERALQVRPSSLIASSQSIKPIETPPMGLPDASNFSRSVAAELPEQHQEKDSTAAVVTSSSVTHLNELRVLPHKYARFQHQTPRTNDDESSRLNDCGKR